jgi:uncharacterized heparinase superfamily protein
MERLPRLRRSGNAPASSRASAFPKATSPLRAARERIGLAVLTADGMRRTALARMRRSRLLGWRHRAPIAYELALGPPDLRPVDPSFADEVASGSMGFAGLTVDLDGASPFAIEPPGPVWARELHGFGWLRHFAAARTLENEALTQRLLAEWLAASRRNCAVAWEPDVVGRRTISWLSHAGLLLDGADRRTRAAVMLGLERQAGYLSASWGDAADGYPRLVALIGLAQSCLCIAGHERRLGDAERHLVRELDRQVLPDGGHLSRNPGVLVALLLDLLPLRQCFGARGFTPPAALLAAIDRIMPMLRRLRLGDGRLARFNGMGATEHDALAMVLAYDRGGSGRGPPVSSSGYVRLERGATAVVVDAGRPPPLDLAGAACAGCLSFELSTGCELLLVNGGLPPSAHAHAAAAARGTASHNTLVLAGQSSAELVRSAGLRRRIGAAPIRHPDRVTCEVGEAEGGIVLRASHDGYVDRFGLIHTRTLVLDAAGACLDGEDALDGAKGEVRFSWDVPVAIHFHLHPLAGARYGSADGSAELILRTGERWRLSAEGATLSIEESTHFADVIGPLQGQQVVLRAACGGVAKVRWRLERVVSDPEGPDTYL